MSKKKKMTKEEKLQEEQAQEAATGIRVRYYPRSFLWNVLAVTLAFLFGIFAALGGLFGVGFLYASKSSAKDLLGDRYSNFVKEDYADLSILDLVTELLSAIDEVTSAGGGLTLNTLAKYTPIFENLLNPLSESLSGMGITLNVSAFLDTPLSGMGAYFQDSVIFPAVLGDTLKLTPESNAIMISLCYGEEGVDYDVVDGKIVMREGKSPITLGELRSGNQSLIDRVTVEDAFSVTAKSNATLRYLAYGTEGTHYKIEDDKIVMLRNQYTGETYRKKRLQELSADGADNAKISDLVSFGSNPSALLQAIKDWKVSDLKHQSRINRLKVGQVVNIDTNSSLLMQAIKDWRIEDLTDQNHIDSLTLGNVLTIDSSSPKLLQSLKDTAIGELGGKIDTLRLSDILEADDIAGNKILRSLGMSTLKSLSSDIQKLSVAQVFGDSLYAYMEGGKGAYLAALKAYRDGTSNVVPTPIPAGADINTVYSREGTTLALGWFCENSLVDASDVYKDTAEGTVRYFTERKLPVTASYTYKRVNYVTGALEEIEYGPLTQDYVDGTVDTAVGEPVEKDGSPLYYYTERVKPQELPEEEPDEELPEEQLPDEESPEESDPLPPEPETEDVAYPLLRDGHGVFCLYLSEEGLIERIDFEELAESYLVGGTTAAAPVLDAEGKPVYDRISYSGEQVRLHHDRDEGDDYILVRQDAEQRYYEAVAGQTEYDTTYALNDDKIDVSYTATWEGQTTAVPVDRFLHGFWYVMFGGEEEKDGELVMIDRSDSAIIGIDTEVTGAPHVINDLTLGQLYFHGIISSDPNHDIGGGKNLRDLTISEAIAYFKTVGN